MVNTTYYYRLTIALNNLNIDQSSDINAYMNSKFSLEAGKKLGTDTIMAIVAGEPRGVFLIHYPDRIDFIDILDINYDIYPTVYLKSNVKISGGNGSPSNPYVIE